MVTPVQTKGVDEFLAIVLVLLKARAQRCGTVRVWSAEGIVKTIDILQRLKATPPI